MPTPHFITALCTPLTDDEELHLPGLRVHLDDQRAHGFDEVLVAGSMGAMQLLTDETYTALIRNTVEHARGWGSVLAGAGDAGFARTRDRILFLNRFELAGIAVLSPYFWKFSQAELVDYFRMLADIAKPPLYLYDLPQVIGTKLAMDTILTLSEHPNIRGAKCSCDFDFTRQLMDRVDDSFRVIVAQANLADVLLRHGVCEQLDGMWSIAPKWTQDLARCAVARDWEGAAASQVRISALRNLLPVYGFRGVTGMMNARGLPGRFAPRPFKQLTAADRLQLYDEPIVRELVEDDPAAAGEPSGKDV